jgi:aryl-alcohol dehydrogenase-like predicted oxidoreductase
VKLVVGANNFGGRLTNVGEALSLMARHGVVELDLARAYVNGECEAAVGAALAEPSVAAAVRSSHGR